MCGHGDSCGHFHHYPHAAWRFYGPADWGPGFRFAGRFHSREERISWLERYLQDLQAEVEEVQKRLAEMKAEA
jgi:hypothetical protein